MVKDLEGQSTPRFFPKLGVIQCLGGLETLQALGPFLRPIAVLIMLIRLPDEIPHLHGKRQPLALSEFSHPSIKGGFQHNHHSWVFCRHILSVSDLMNRSQDGISALR